MSFLDALIKLDQMGCHFKAAKNSNTLMQNSKLIWFAKSTSWYAASHLYVPHVVWHSNFVYAPIAFHESFFWLQCAHCLGYVALFVHRLKYNHFTITHAYSAANARTRQWPGMLKPKSYSLVESNQSIDAFRNCRVMWFQYIEQISVSLYIRFCVLKYAFSLCPLPVYI